MSGPSQSYLVETCVCNWVEVSTVSAKIPPCELYSCSEWVDATLSHQSRYGTSELEWRIQGFRILSMHRRQLSSATPKSKTYMWILGLTAAFQTKLSNDVHDISKPENFLKQYCTMLITSMVARC